METRAVATTEKRGHPLMQRYAMMRRRRNYLVDSATQFQIVRQFVVVLLVGMTLGICNVHVFDSLTRAGLGVAAGGADWVDQAIVFAYVGTLLAVSILLMYLLCLFYSHRVGGPTMKIAEALRRMAEGDLWVNVKLREADLLKDVARSVNVTASSWRKALRDIEWVVAHLEHHADKDPQIAEQIEAVSGRTRRSRPPGTVEVQSFVARMNANETLCSVSRSFDLIFAVSKESPMKRNERLRNIVIQR